MATRSKPGTNGIGCRGPAAGALALVAVVAVIIVAPVAAQVVLDRVLAHVNGRVITEADVHQARLLHLVDDTTSDDATAKALENRALILGEIARSAALPAPTPADLAGRRHEWEAAVGGPANVSRLLGEGVMTDASLQAWLRDDLRIRAYVARQFDALSDADRAKAIADWLARLRDRAGLQ